MKRTMNHKNKFNRKRFSAAAVAGLSAAAVVITAVFSRPMEVEAADTLLGIEKLRARYKASGSEFTILEIVPDRAAAEIGFLVDGYEPVLSEWNEEEMTWTSWQNTLCSLPTAARRKEFVEKKKAELREYYAEQGIKKNFPVEISEEEYEESSEKAEGFQKLVSDGDKSEGWFVKGSADGEQDKYQLSFKYRGKYDLDDYPIDPDLLYYTVSSSMKIDSDVAGGIEDDRFVYKKEKDAFVCLGTWAEIREKALSSILNDTAEEEVDKDKDDSDDSSNTEDEKDDDDSSGSDHEGSNGDGSEDEESNGGGDGSDDEDGNGNGGGSGNEGSNGDGNGSGNEDGNGNSGGSGNEGSNGDGNGSGNEDGNGNGGGSGNEDGNGDGSGTGNEGSNGGDNSEGTASGNVNEDSGSDGEGNGSNTGGSNSSNNGNNSGNTGGSANGSAESASIAGAAKAVVFAAADFRQGKWFRLVADNEPGSDNGTASGGQQGSGDDANAGGKPGADNDVSAGGTGDDSTKPGDNPDSDSSTKPGDNAGSDDSQNSGDNTGTDDNTGSGNGADSDNDPNPDDGSGSGDHEDSDDSTGSDDETDSDTDTDDELNPDDPDGDDADSDDTDADGDDKADQPGADDPIDDEDEEENRKDVFASEQVSAYYLVAFEKVTDYSQLTEKDSIYTVDAMVLSDNGEYVFVEWDGTDESQTRQVYTFPGKEIWCKNAFKSNEWFRKYVINMDKKDYADFKIKVLTYTPQELNEMEQLPNFQFLYLNSGLRATGIWSGGSSDSGEDEDKTEDRKSNNKRNPGDGKDDEEDEEDETSGGDKKDDKDNENGDGEDDNTDDTTGGGDDGKGHDTDDTTGGGDDGKGDGTDDTTGGSDNGKGDDTDETTGDDGKGDSTDDASGGDDTGKDDNTDDASGGVEDGKDDGTGDTAGGKGDNTDNSTGSGGSGQDDNNGDSADSEGAGRQPVSSVLRQSGWNMLVADSITDSDSDNNQSPAAGDSSDQTQSPSTGDNSGQNQDSSAGGGSDNNQGPATGNDSDGNNNPATDDDSDESLSPSTGNNSDEDQGSSAGGDSDGNQPPTADDDSLPEIPPTAEDGADQGQDMEGGSDGGNDSGVGDHTGDISGNDPGDVSGNDVGNKEVKKYSAQDNDLSADLLKYFFDKTIAGAMPCLVDGSILYVKDDSGSIVVNEELENTNIFRLSAMLCQDNLSEWYESHRNNYNKLTTEQLMKGIVDDADRNFVEEQVYCRFGNDSIINDQFYSPTIYQDGGEIEPGFQCVLDEIKLDNLYRESDTSGNYKPLSTSISQAKAVRHILNYRDRRKVETKKEIRVLEIQPAMADEPELSLDQIKAWAPGVEKADITVMTTAEFIGKIEKLNETYDLIYIGTSKDHLNMRYWTDNNYIGKPDEKHVAAGTVFNDADMDGLIYYNIGDLRVVNLPMAGLLTTEYRNGNRNDWTWFYNYVRYGGNDISKEKKNALLSFLDGSYPVIIADDFLEQPVTVFAESEYKGARVNLTEGEYTSKQLAALGVKRLDISSVKVKEGYRLTVFDGDEFTGNRETFTKDVPDFTKQVNGAGNWDNKTLSLIIEREENASPDRAIDEDHIDNCTYLYEFVTKAMKDKYLNFYAKGDIADNSELFKFYLNRPKVSLTNTAVGGEAEEGSDIYYINPDVNGRYKLQYAFNIKNEGTASYNTKYRCKLYIDVNSDGKFSKQEEVEDITITQGGNLVSAEELYADTGYLLTRDVPTGYKGLLPWRVEITQADNPNIYTSLNGYTKLNGMDKEVLKICQINKNGDDVINLNYEVNTKGRHFNTLVYGGQYDGADYSGIADEFDLDITTINIDEFERNYYANNDYLKDFNMLILGFSDMYGDFSGNAESGPMGAIVDFINSGKSVLLGHDTTSFFNSPDLGQGPQAMKGYPWRNNATPWGNKSEWYYTRNAATLNKYVRPLVGMDRYGILSSEILQRGNILRQGTNDYDTVVNSDKDVAYKPKSGKKETVPEVHGYTYSLISAKDQKVLLDEGTTSKYQYTKWNMTSDNYHRYPEIVFENKYTNIRFDASHFWENYDGVEEDPARYGELEKVNNGEVWNVHATQVNKGQITEYPYKLKEEFEVALTHAQYYELDYTADDDGDGQSDLVVWYCLGKRTSPTGHSDWVDTIYSQSPNDVRNNYYIYNKGNITYTGMGHARKNQNEEWYTFEEAKLFINTMIASYQAGIKSPQITVLKQGVPESEELKLLYRYYDNGVKSDGSDGFYLSDAAETEDYEKLYFTVQDINFVKGTRAIATHVYYKADGGAETINVDGNDISVNRLADSMYNAKDDSPVDANNLTSGGVYYIRVPRTLMKQCGEGDGLEFYFEAQSTITTNTTNANVYITDKVYAKLQVLQAYLFNLE